MSLPPIGWLPSPYHNTRDGRYPIRAEVKHRIVGTLSGARGAFGVAPGSPRKASTHFGIGYVGGRLTIDQYVDLSDMAWGNGDVRDPSWSRIIPGVNPNLYTVSTEHEDGGSANRGRVSAAVWQASMQLSKLLRCGDLVRIRAAGIRVRRLETVAQLAAMPIDPDSYIDHHQIAGPNKPHCFRRWLDDPGFVDGAPSRRDRLLTHLAAEDDFMSLPMWPKTVTWTTGTGPVDGAFRALDPATGQMIDKHFVSPETVTTILEQVEVNEGRITTPSDRSLLALYPDPSIGPEVLIFPRSSLTNPRNIRNGLPGSDPAAVTAAVKAATDPLVEKLRLAREAGVAIGTAAERLVEVAS